jgi:DNA-binding beta-propeller fold protein YncE
LALVADYTSSRIRKVTISTGKVETLKDASNAVISFSGICGVHWSPDGKYAFAVLLFAGVVKQVVVDPAKLAVCDAGSHTVRRVTLQTYEVETLAGSVQGYSEGTGGAALFSSPYGVTFDSAGLYLYVADKGNHRIRRIDANSKAVTLFAGSGSVGSTDGTGAGATFNSPTKVVMSPDGAHLFVTSVGDHRIRRIVTASQVVSTLVGSSAGHADSSGLLAMFNQPNGIALSPSGTDLYVAEIYRIRKVNLGDLSVTTYAGSGSAGSSDGVGLAASFDQPVDLQVRTPPPPPPPPSYLSTP